MLHTEKQTSCNMPYMVSMLYGALPTEQACRYSLNFSMEELESEMSLNMPSSLLVNWQPHSVCNNQEEGVV